MYPYPTPCDHTGGNGLCPECQEEFDADPDAWEEFGAHPVGRENWRRLQEEIAQGHADDPQLQPSEVDCDIPF